MTETKTGRHSTGGRLLAPSDWKDRFFKALIETNLPYEACKAAGVSRTYAYKQRREDPEFAEVWADCIERGTEILEQIAVRRAAEGSDTLMMFILKSRRPEVYRENVHHEHDHQHHVEGQIELLDGRQPIQVNAAKRREAARLLLTEESESETTDAESEEIPDADVVEDAAA